MYKRACQFGEKNAAAKQQPEKNFDRIKSENMIYILWNEETQYIRISS